MKFLNGQKPDVAQDTIISAAVVVVLIGVTVFLFRCTDNPKNTQTQNTPSSSAIKKGMPASPLILSDSFCAETLENSLLAEVPGMKKHTRDFVYRMPDDIVPPIPSLAPRPFEKQVRASVGEIITTTRNSRIIVPPNAFLDEKGNVVEGNVDINFREFHNFRDIFLSGIPMHYDSAGANDMLESAGMVELTASKDGKAVFVNPSAKIKMMLASSYKTKDYNLYYYDKKQNKWIYKGRDELVLMDPGTGRNRGDRTAYSPRMDFRYTAPVYKVGMQCRSDLRDQRKFFFSKKASPESFDFRFVSCPSLSPNVRELRGVTWRYKGADAREVFMQIFKTIDIESSEAAMVTFKGAAGITLGEDSAWHLFVKQDSLSLNIPVEPILKNTSEEKSFGLKLKRYTVAIEKMKNHEKEAYAVFQKDTLGFYRTSSGSYRTSSKGCFGEMTAETVALRTFEVSGFGIWNCDRRFTPPVANNVYARFEDEKGNSLQFNTAYLVDRNNNSVYTIVDFTQFRFDPESRNLCWAVLPGDKMAIISPAEFDRHRETKSGPCTFTAKISATALRSHSELQAALKFN